MYFTASDGAKIYYETYGEENNPSIFLLHGIGGDHAMWKPQVRKYADEGFFVVAMDLRGHGSSEKVDKLTLDDWNRDILDLAKKLDIDRIHCLIGVSMGGVISQSFAANYPEKINKLVLCDTFGELKTFKEKLLGYSQVIGFRIFSLLGNKTFAKAMSSYYKEDHAQKAKKYFYDVSLKAHFNQLILARKAINNVKVLEKLKKVDVESLVLVGDLAGENFVNINRKISDSLKNSIFKIIRNSKDPSNLVNQREFDNNVLQFIKN
ncbi:alpha/beta hydrolase [Thermohalobacter berrensis]|uniref:AB hydrolase-1 domain-containing protein n=1 Tax=Thermohalobacter berrensis TaxID=99594 RepID=A0A419SZ39_9FIRM|nr:alpha/beta hydrolase [Thermohalobacter berrensis]RKD30514.1 hypothetical protein BET03_04030 [Thermohalobacter berrensis]